MYKVRPNIFFTQNIDCVYFKITMSLDSRGNSTVDCVEPSFTDIGVQKTGAGATYHLPKFQGVSLRVSDSVTFVCFLFLVTYPQ